MKTALAFVVELFLISLCQICAKLFFSIYFAKNINNFFVFRFFKFLDYM